MISHGASTHPTVFKRVYKIFQKIDAKIYFSEIMGGDHMIDDKKSTKTDSSDKKGYNACCITIDPCCCYPIDYRGCYVDQCGRYVDPCCC